MKLKFLALKNFRCFQNELLELGSYTPLVGANNSGKSTALRAIDIFFQSTPKSIPLTQGDFSASNMQDPLEIGLVFSDLATEEEDDFGHYARGGKLHFLIRAHLQEDGSIAASIFGVRLARPDLANYFEATNATEKKKVYEQFRQDGLVSEAWKNEETSTALIVELDRADPELWKPLESSDKAYGAVGPVARIRKYLEWIYIPAVKNASEEASENKNSAFSKLALKAIRDRIGLPEKVLALQKQFNIDLDKALEEELQPLEELSYVLTKEFRSLTSSRIDVKISWDPGRNTIDLEQPAVRTQFIDGPVRAGPEYFGHGLQRTYIMALLPLVARYSGQSHAGPKLLLGIEEPELYQHPPQARFLAESLIKLCENSAQIILSTHNPYFVNARKFDEIRVIRKRGAHSISTRWSTDEHRQYYAKLIESKEIGSRATVSALDKLLQPNVSEIFFCNRAILVEGSEDIAIISSYMRLTNRWNEFLRLGSSFISANGKSGLPSLITLCRGFKIPHYAIFDFDMGNEADQRNNEVLRKFIKPLEFVLPEEVSEDLFHDTFTCWTDNIQSSILTCCANWKSVKDDIAKEWGWTVKRMDKDPMLLEEAIERTYDGHGKLDPLERICDRLLNFS